MLLFLSFVIGSCSAILSQTVSKTKCREAFVLLVKNSSFIFPLSGLATQFQIPKILSSSQWALGNNLNGRPISARYSCYVTSRSNFKISGNGADFRPTFYEKIWRAQGRKIRENGQQRRGTLRLGERGRNRVRGTGHHRLQRIWLRRRRGTLTIFF